MRKVRRIHQTSSKIRSAGFLLITQLLFASALKAQVHQIVIATANQATVLQSDSTKDLNMIYFGEKLENAREYGFAPEMFRQSEDYSGMLASAYTSAGSRNLMEPALSVTHADGNNSLDLKYVDDKVETVSEDIKLYTIHLKDPVYPFEVTLFYKAYYKENVVEQWALIKHHESGPVIINKVASANLYLKSSSFWLRQYHGDWAKEMQPEESKLTHGIKTLDTKLGTRADLYQPPVFMISMGKPATENEGRVMYGSMEWSSNFKMDLELDPLDNLRIIAGINDYASAFSLKPDEEFSTPLFLYTFSDKGKGQASRQLQDWARTYRIVDGKGSRLTLLNNWESTYFNFDEQKLKELLKDTKKLGVDLFLLDDGWFGNKYPRDNDHTALGDWQEDRKKLPNGIASIAKEAKAEGVKFGIWIEPEMVSPKSELYEKHPDWVIRQAGRKEYYYRHQLVLDLSNPKVQDFVFNVVDSLFIKDPGLAYIKWDCNAVIYNAYSAYLKDQNQFYVKYVRGLYGVLIRLRAKYPKIPMMLCSGGGGRIDYDALRYFTEFWPSDNTDPLERIFIQWDNSYFYPALASSNHVTDWGKQPLKYRVDAAMMGKLGFDLVISKLGEQDLSFCQHAVSLYNSLKEIIWQGEQYRLSDPHEEPVASILYLNGAKTSGVIFNYLVNNRYGQGSKMPIRLNGLDAAKRYKLNEVNLYPRTKSMISDQVYSGDFLMKIGFNPVVNASRSSVVLKIDAVQ